MVRWKLAHAEPEAVSTLMAATGLPQMVCKLLAARGKTDAAAVQEFIAGTEKLADPFLLADMQNAVNRIAEAVENGEKIVVYGDYDCDGVTATALLYSYLETIGADVLYYIPDREVEGYGLNNEAIKFLREIRKVDLLITVDNGISALEEVDYANSLGMDVIVTDHHTPRETLPNAVAVLNPHRHDDESEFKNLAGVGVAFKLAAALEGELGYDLLAHYGELVAIGTVADIVELRGENRILVREGLAALQATERMGLKALLEKARMKRETADAQSIAFGIAPRINAAGRMGDVYHALELFLTEDVPTAEALAETLCTYNQTRKEIESTILAQIKKTLQATPQPLYERVLLVDGEGWHPGVIGIIASKLVETYGKPCFVVAFDDNGVGRASGRSIGGVSVIDGLKHAGAHLVRYGGHKMAAGFTVTRANYEAFKKAFLAYYATTHPQMPPNTVLVDAVLEPAELTVAGLEAMDILRPFGEGNPAPLYALVGFTIEGITPIGEGKHLLTASKRGKTIWPLLFGVTAAAFPFGVGEKVDMLADIGVDEYGGEKKCKIRVVDIRLSGFKQDGLFSGLAAIECYRRGEEVEAILKPEREEIGEVYRYIKKSGGCAFGLLHLYERLFRTIPFEKLCIAVDCLEELGLITVSGGYFEKTLCLAKGDKKVDLTVSHVLQKAGDAHNRKGERECRNDMPIL